MRLRAQSESRPALTASGLPSFPEPCFRISPRKWSGRNGYMLLESDAHIAGQATIERPKSRAISPSRPATSFGRDALAHRHRRLKLYGAAGRFLALRGHRASGLNLYLFAKQSRPRRTLDRRLPCRRAVACSFQLLVRLKLTCNLDAETTGPRLPYGAPQSPAIRQSRSKIRCM